MSKTTHEDFAENWSPARGAKDLRIPDVSRDPEEYEPSTHLLQRLKERKVLDFPMIAEAIEQGAIIERDPEGVVLEYDWLQTTLRVVVAPEGGIIETAYEVEG